MSVFSYIFTIGAVIVGVVWLEVGKSIYSVFFKDRFESWLIAIKLKHENLRWERFKKW
jgi:hypothetical protein